MLLQPARYYTGLYYMSASKDSDHRKRPCSQLSRAEIREPQSKRRKLCDSPTPSASPAFYLYSLSKIWLTKEALRELDREIKQIRSSQADRPALQVRRPLTRAFHAELRSRVRSGRTPASNFLQGCTPETLKEVKVSAKHGGPDLLDLRGYPEPADPSRYPMSSAYSRRRPKRGKRGSNSTSQTQPTSTGTTITKQTRSSGSYNPNFHQRMIDNGIYPDGYEYPDGRTPPTSSNWDEIQQMLVERRASLSPSVLPEEWFREFKRADAQVSSENKATRKVIPMIQGPIQDERCVDGDIPFNHLADMMGGKSHKAKPDVYYGARPEQLHSDIRDKLGAYVVPSTTDIRPCAPNFFVEAKRPGASAAVALGQACFAGAVGARGIHQLQTYGQEVPAYDNHAYTLSATYHAGQLKMYAHHTAQPNGPGTQPEYYMNQLNTWGLTGNRKTLVEGITAFRNVQGWTEAQRSAAIEHANAIANGVDDDNDDYDDDDDEEEDDFTAGAVSDPLLSSFTSASPFSTGQDTSWRSRTVRQESETSADELALEHQSSKRSGRGQNPH
ncbi:MAG: hypothetical protein M1817_003901 [Caeruleum heppii]|nr:MAG: hypothetical protein M1817_003901 [Caeruleum heppii]